MAAVEAALLERLEALAPGCDAILVSHYRSGVLTPTVVERVRQLARQHGLFTAADAQADLARFAGFDLVKCNRAEAEAELGQSLASEDDFERALTRLLPLLGVEHLVVTRGSDGMSALQRGHAVIHSPAVPVGEVYDVVGAGDTAVAVLALALAARLTLSTAAHLANAAAGLVVRRLGNAVVRPAELIEALSWYPRIDLRVAASPPNEPVDRAGVRRLTQPKHVKVSLVLRASACFSMLCGSSLRFQTQAGLEISMDSEHRWSGKC